MTRKRDSYNCIYLRPSIASALRERYPHEVQAQGLSWLVAFIVSESLGLPVPETRSELSAQAGRRGSKGKGNPRICRK